MFSNAISDCRRFFCVSALKLRAGFYGEQPERSPRAVHKTEREFKGFTEKFAPLKSQEI
jgi:hypothetical protein